MSIELNVALPGFGGGVETHYLSIHRLGPNLGDNTYEVLDMTPHDQMSAVFPHRYEEGWEHCVSRALGALADARRPAPEYPSPS